MAAVTLKNLSTLGGGELPAGGGLNLEIRDREFVVLAGPAGCGNSTILRMIAGVEQVPHGEILLDNRRLNDVPPNGRDVALVSHDYVPYPLMSVYENLAFGLERRNFAKTEIKKRVLAVAEILGLEEQLPRRPQALSGEERQLTALARAMVQQPKVFLFDHPFSTLPADAQTRGRAQIKKLQQRLAAPMIYATHDATEAMAIGERIVVLEQGVVEQEGNAQTIYAEPANLFVASFTGDLPMNLVHGILKEERDSILFSEAGDGTIAIRWPISRLAAAKDVFGGPIVLGIRPENVDIASPSGAGPSPRTFRALVDRVEPRGADTVLYLQTGAHELVSRSRRWVDQGEGGHRFEFEIELEKAHFFDPASGRRITQEP
jgi:multiple sugar transport system ATP-binding protein